MVQPEGSTVLRVPSHMLGRPGPPTVMSENLAWRLAGFPSGAWTFPHLYWALLTPDQRDAMVVHDDTAAAAQSAVDP